MLLMFRKLAVVAIVALVPGFAFAADTGAKAPVADSATHAVSGDVKADSSVKTDAAAKPGKAVHKRVHKAKVEKTKAGTATDGKTDGKS
jgi:hypothetical protein